MLQEPGTRVDDVLIIGAGPGGAAAAINCALSGLRVTLIEGSTFPREKPGETLHPGVEPLLRQLGVWEEVLAARFLRHNGNWVGWNGDTRFEPFGSDDGGSWQGLQAGRADFDGILLRRAQDLGVAILQPCRALRPLRKGGRVAGLLTATGKRSARFVIDASGSTHWLARHLRLAIKPYSPRLIARYGYVSGECPQRNDAPLIAADGEGWTWTARVNEGIYQWTRLSFSDQHLAKGWRPAELRGLRVWRPSRGMDVTWRMVMPAAGPGYFITGDAAAVLDPSSSHGVLKAIMSGMMAGFLIAQVLEPGSRITEPVAAVEYCRWLHSWFHHDVSRLKDLYSKLGRRADFEECQSASPSGERESR